MRLRIERRRAERVQAAADLCQVPLTEWLAMSRRERKRRLRIARWDGGE